MRKQDITKPEVMCYLTYWHLLGLIRSYIYILKFYSKRKSILLVYIVLKLYIVGYL